MHNNRMDENWIIFITGNYKMFKEASMKQRGHKFETNGSTNGSK